MDPAYARLHALSDFDPAAVVDTSRVAVMAVSDPFEPDDRTPAHVRDAAIASLHANASHYASPFGERDLRVEIARKMRRVNGMTIDPDANVLVAPGADPLLTFCARPFLEPGARNEILTPIPAFNSNLEVGALAGGVTVPVPTYAEDGYELRVEELERRLTPRTKLVLITNPNNPTGTVYSRRSLEQLAEFVTTNDLVLLSDQAFEEVVFDGEELTQVATLPGMAERTIVICSLSKGMGLCGYRIGYAVASADVVDMLSAVAPHVFGAANTAAQAAAVAALREPQFVEEYRREHMARADAIGPMLSAVPKISWNRPRGGFFLWIDVAAYGGGAQVMRYLAEEASVLVTDGAMFGSADHIRLVYSAFADRERCLQAVERVVQALQRHPAVA